MKQRHVVDRQLAERMFPELMGFGNGVDIAPAEITWLVGPIRCETCDGSGNVQVYGRNSPPCPDCNGLGYPPTVEIVSEMEVHPGNEPYDVVHGVVKLGKPVLIVGQVVIESLSLSDEVIVTDGVGVFLWPASSANEIITDQIGPCEAGQVAYPVEAVPSPRQQKRNP